MGDSRQPLDLCQALTRWSTSGYCDLKHQQQRLDNGKLLTVATWAATSCVVRPFKIEVVPSVESSSESRIGSRRPERHWELVPHHQAVRMLARRCRCRG